MIDILVKKMYTITILIGKHIEIYGRKARSLRGWDTVIICVLPMMVQLQ